MADVAEQRGAGFVNRSMLVQIQSSALWMTRSRWCNGQHKTLLRSRSWFESRLGRLAYETISTVSQIDWAPPRVQVAAKSRSAHGYLASVMDSTAVFETTRRGSIPWRGTDVNLSLECAGFR